MKIHLIRFFKLEMLLARIVSFITRFYCFQSIIVGHDCVWTCYVEYFPVELTISALLYTSTALVVVFHNN